MTTPGDPNHPRPNDGERPSRDEPGRPPSEDEPTGRAPGDSGTGANGEPGVEEPITPAPPVVPPEERPRPGGEPRTPFHPDLPTSPETPGPAADQEGGAEETQVFPMPGARPAYPGWEREGGEPGAPRSTTPSRYEPATTPPEEPPPSAQDDRPSFAPPGAQPPPSEETRPLTPSGEGAGPSYGEARPQPSDEGAEWPFEDARPQPPGEGVGPSYGEARPPGSPYEGGPGGYGPPPTYRDIPPKTEPIPAVPGTSPSSPYGGPPGGGGPPYGLPPGYGPYQTGQPVKPGNGLATASLVLGVASPFLVFVCFTGLLTAILSIVFGSVALSRGVGKGRAITGIAISVLALIIFAIVAIWFWNVVQECGHLPGQLADKCFEDKFPWMRRNA
ncbi:hypothetical protein AB0F17_10410 [Nonomuraea sp. NPDC026600]|uniref:hypothetical protein n=1 Tax=Nonomuraea sp. NPDC026600 TaxID=3155363 RepID=UPI0033E8F00F